MYTARFYMWSTWLKGMLECLQTPCPNTFAGILKHETTVIQYDSLPFFSRRDSDALTPKITVLTADIITR